VSAGSAAAALGPPAAENEPDLSDLLWDSNDLLSLTDLLDDNDAAWPPADGLPFLPLEQHDQGRVEGAPLVCFDGTLCPSHVPLCNMIRSASLLALQLHALQNGSAPTFDVPVFESESRQWHKLSRKPCLEA